MSRRLLLLRHPLVDTKYRGLCYGSSNVPLSDAGQAMIPQLVDDLLAYGLPEIIYSSPLQRCCLVAEALARRSAGRVVLDPRLQERHFGEWELRSWEDLYRETGNAMQGMIDDPAHWRPPGGETTFELRDRVLGWHQTLPPSGLIVAVTHGGPIAVLRGTFSRQTVPDWLKLTPEPGEIVQFDNQQ
jgi:alpha-ribazole phosphatase